MFAVADYEWEISPLSVASMDHLSICSSCWCLWSSYCILVAKKILTLMSICCVMVYQGTFRAIVQSLNRPVVILTPALFMPLALSF